MRILLALSAFLVFVEEQSERHQIMLLVRTISNFFPGTAKFSIQISFTNFMKLTDGKIEL
jgi:hypothetical protein